MIRTLGEKTDVVASKAHRCGLCGLSIPAGSTHYTQRNADETSAWTWRAHTECARRITEFWEWCGTDIRYVDEYEDIAPDEFRRFLAT